MIKLKVYLLPYLYVQGFLHVKGGKHERYLVLVDRKIEFHFEAFYLFTLLKSLKVIIDICEGNQIEYEIYLKREYHVYTEFKK